MGNGDIIGKEILLFLGVLIILAAYKTMNQFLNEPSWTITQAISFYLLIKLIQFLKDKKVVDI